MKKLFYVLTLVLLLAVVPVSTVEAKTTKPDKPTVEVKYSTKSDKWLLRFNCKTKGATVKCKDFEQTKYKTVKVGKWLDAGNYTYCRLYSEKGKAKSRVYTYDIDELQEAKRSADMHKVVDKYVDKNASEFVKLAGIVDFFMHSGHYKYDWNIKRHSEPWYLKGCMCEELAIAFKYICEQYGLKCQLVADYKADHAWNYVYLEGDKKPLIMDATCLIIGVVEPQMVSMSVYTKYGKIVPSKRDKCKNGLSVLEYAGYAKYGKDKITLRSGDLPDDFDGVDEPSDPAYDDYISIFTYSKKDGFWTEHEYDSNGIEAKLDPEIGEYTWSWYYGDDYPGGCAELENK